MEELFQPIHLLKSRIRKTFFTKRILYNIDYRKSHIQDIKSYQFTHNNKLPKSMTCISVLLNNFKIFKNNPFKYDYEPQKGLEGDETAIISEITKVCMKYLNRCHNGRNNNNNNNNNVSNINSNNNSNIINNNNNYHNYNRSNNNINNLFHLSKNRVNNNNNNTSSGNRISQLRHDNSSYLSGNRINHFKESINYKTAINHTNKQTQNQTQQQQSSSLQHPQLVLSELQTTATSEYDESSNYYYVANNNTSATTTEGTAAPLTPSSHKALQTAACYGKSNRSMKTSVFSTVMEDESCRRSVSKSESTMVLLGQAYSSSQLQNTLQQQSLKQSTNTNANTISNTTTSNNTTANNSNSVSPLPNQAKRYINLNSNNNNNNRVIHLPGTCSGDSTF